MKTIYKYAVPFITDTPTEVRMPEGAEILDLQIQNRVPTIWALVEPENPTEIRRFNIVGTGWPTPDDCGDYIATAQDDPYVWHFFEIRTHQPA